MKNVFMALSSPDCVPMLTRDPRNQRDAHPKYLVRSKNELYDLVKRDDAAIRIIDLGEGSSLCI